MTERHTHSCGAWWTTLRAAHCASCHRTFVSVAAFDKHRDRDYKANPRGACLDPATQGLVERTRESGGDSYKVWGMPTPEGTPWWEKLRGETDDK